MLTLMHAHAHAHADAHAHAHTRAYDYASFWRLMLVFELK
jgi:hypothetical protein